MILQLLREVCGYCRHMENGFICKESIEEIRNKVGEMEKFYLHYQRRDSSVAAGLLSRAIGKQLTCVFVDHGFAQKRKVTKENVRPNGHLT